MTDLLQVTLFNRGGPLATETAVSPANAVDVAIKLIMEAHELEDGDTIKIESVDD